jgi:hypothetical protein
MRSLRINYFYIINRALFLSALLLGPVLIAPISSEVSQDQELIKASLYGYLKREFTYVLFITALINIPWISKLTRSDKESTTIKVSSIILLLLLSFVIFTSLSLLLKAQGHSFLSNTTLIGIITLISFTTLLERVEYKRAYIFFYSLTTVLISTGGIIILQGDITFLPAMFAFASGMWSGCSLFKPLFFVTPSSITSRQLRNGAAFLILAPALILSTLSLLNILPLTFRFFHVFLILFAFTLHKQRNSSNYGFANLILTMAWLEQLLLFVLLLKG